MRNVLWGVAGLAGIALGLSGCGKSAPEVKPQEFDVLVAEPRGQLITGATVKVHGFIAGGEASQVTVGKAVAKLGPGGRWEAEVPAGTDGAHTLKVTARAAKGGKTAAVEVAWTTDNTPPVVTITSDLRAAALRGDAVRIEGTVEDASPVTLEAHGQPLQLDGNRFEFTKMLTEGANEIVVKAVDAAGHVTEHKSAFVRDTQPPSVQLAEIPAKVASATFTVTGEVSEPGCRVFVNGEEAAVEGTTFTFALPLEAGPNPFIVVVRDVGGLEATAEGSVELERRKPLTEDELLAVLRRHASSGAGWYDGQFDELKVFGEGLHPTLIALTEKLCLAEGQRQLAMQGTQCLGELGVTDAIPMLNKVIDLTDDNALKDSIVFILARLGDTAKADAIIENYRRMIETTPTNAPNLWVQVGNGYARMKAYQKAENAYRKAIAVAKEQGQPAPGVAWYNLACQIAKLGQRDEAMAAIHERMKLPQPDVDWMATDGDLASLRDHEEFLKYLWVDGTEPQLRRRAAMIGRTHPKSALLVLRKSAERFPDDINAWIFLATAAADGGELEEGAKALARTVELSRGGLKWDLIDQAPQFAPLKKLPNYEALKSGNAPEPPKKDDKEDF